MFKDTDQKQSFEILNLLRNAAMHSGGKFNSKIERDARKFLSIYFGSRNVGDKNKKGLFEVSKLEISYEILFEQLLNITDEISNRITKTLHNSIVK